MLTIKQIKQIEEEISNTLGQISQTFGIQFNEVRNTRHYTLHPTGRPSFMLGILKTRILSDGKVQANIVPDVVFRNYTEVRRFNFDGLDGIDKSEDFTTFVREFRDIIGYSEETLKDDK